MNRHHFAAATLLFLTVFNSCRSRPHLFERIHASHSGLAFNNLIIENDSINILNIENLYNGGGVGIGDFNNDGLQDIYFTASLVSNKMYLNRGDFHFEDITAAAGTDGQGRWCRGVAVLDINDDGWQDLYICTTLATNPQARRNLLYINQGNDAEGIPIFAEEAEAYGLADTSHSTQAAFFDYDNDGDLDVYIVNNVILKNGFENRFQPKVIDGSQPNTDKLFRNDWDSVLKHPVFTDQSTEAGILIEGYGHSVNITDINNDGWPDIYVANDFISNDLLWINNRNGSFTEQLSAYFKHSSANAMGSDIADFNNDGLVDVITLDMNPEDNFRKKTMLNPNNYTTYQNSDRFGYNYQYVRNTLQLNQGLTLAQNDTISHPVFSEIGFYAGIAETDWSWAPVVADFDNDGFKDIIVTNGFPKDLTDRDFILFRQQSAGVASTDQLLSQIPEVKLPNYAFRNNGNLTFSNVTADWHMEEPSFSNGAVFVDLDNDGDLDVVINNINQEAFLYKNHHGDQHPGQNNYIDIRFKGSRLNPDGIGARVTLFYQDTLQLYENNPFRGYLSTVAKQAHFGLSSRKNIDSLLLHWPDGKEQVLRQLKANQLLIVDVKNATQPTANNLPLIARHTLIREITDSVGINYVHRDRDYIDFNVQRLLPHKLSEYGPALAVGDLNGDGLDDLVSGGSFFFSARLFFQQSNGKFLERSLLTGTDSSGKQAEDMGLLLFDADGDKDLDLYIASGGYEADAGSAAYLDRLYINNGRGDFALAASALPAIAISKSCVRAADIDKDNDLDLFVSGRVDPGKYPLPVSSFILRNDSKNGVAAFTDITASAAPELISAGMICDGRFTDIDNDGWPDLLLAGEWMPIRFLKNKGGRFSLIDPGSGLEGSPGWWNSVTAGDFDNDGDMDYVLGNAGTNSYYRADSSHPVAITAKDFDNNGRLDAFPSVFLPNEKGERQEFPMHSRDELLEQLPTLRPKFNYYHSFASARFKDIFPPDHSKAAVRLEANQLSSVYVENKGQGKFSIKPLPVAAQWSQLNGLLAEDIDGDGNLDLLIAANDYGTELSVGRYDAMNGLLLLGNGDGSFRARSILQSGFYLPGNGKALVKLNNGQGQTLLAASQNKGPIKLYHAKEAGRTVSLAPDDTHAELLFKNNRKQRVEIPYGSSFLSQSSRFLNIPAGVNEISITNVGGKTRKLLPVH